MFRPLLLGAITLSLALAGCNSSSVTGSGKITTDSRQLSLFKGITISGNYEVNIVAQKSPAVEIKTDDNIVSKIITEIKDNILHIHPIEGKHLAPSKTVQLNIAIPDLNSININGDNRIEATNLSSQQLSVSASGSSQINLSGKTNEIIIKASGSTELDAQNLSADTARVSSNGAAKIKVHANKSLDVAISGSGRVNYSGHPARITQTVHGSGEVLSIE